MNEIKVAAVCMHSEPNAPENNLCKIETNVFKAAENGADIVCFPELSATGYTLKDPLSVYKHFNPDRIIKRLSHMAIKSRCIVMAGMIEPSGGDRPFITHVITGPNGLMGRYRKTHLSPAEQDAYLAGDDLPVYSCGDITFGIQLCYEAHFPEISTVMALMGADILFVPHASPRGRPRGKLNSWLRHLRARAFDNGVFIVACNQVGKNMEGFLFPAVSVVLGPDGRIMASYAGKDEKILFVDINTERLNKIRQHRMKYFLPQRRPDMYKIISRQSSRKK